MIFRHMKVLIITLVLSQFLFSQSFLSINYPLGILNKPIHGNALAMGHSGSAVKNSYYLHLFNPANLGFVTTNSYTALFFIDYLRIKRDNSYSDFIDFMPQMLAFSFPVYPVGTFAFSYNKKSEKYLKYASFQTIPASSSGFDNDIELRFDYKRWGGINSWSAAYGRTVFKWLSLGITYSREYFTQITSNIESAYEIFKTDSSQEKVKKYGVKDSSSIKLRTNTFSLGLMGSIKKVYYSIKYSYNIPAEAILDTNTYEASNNNTSQPIDGKLSYSEKFLIKLPPQIQLGLAYFLSESILFSYDMNFIFWKFSRFPNNGYLFVPENNISYTVGGGMEYVVAPYLLQPKYWQTIRYRIGARYSALEQKDNFERAFSFGFGLPFAKKSGIMDFSVELGQRINKNINDYKENFIYVGIGLNGGKKWRKREDLY